MPPLELPTDPAVPAADVPAQQKWKDSLLRTWIPPVVVALYVIGFVAQLFVVPSGSMEKTLLVGDHVVVGRVQLSPPPAWFAWLLPYRSPRRDEVIAFKSPVEPGMFLVKRVVGIPGDHIRLIHGVLYRNGKAVSEPWAIHTLPYDAGQDDWPDAQLFGQTQAWQTEQWKYFKDGAIVVPAGEYFVLGDNRDNSFDSRYWGFVPAGNVIGRPLLVYWSERSRSENDLHQPPLRRLRDWFSELIHLPVQTRWTRTLHVIH